MYILCLITLLTLLAKIDGFKRCHHVTFIEDIPLEHCLFYQMTGEVLISADQISDDFRRKVNLGIKSSCIVGHLRSKSQTSPQFIFDVTRFMGRLQANEKTLILDRIPVESNFQNLVENIHRSYEIQIQNGSGTVERFPVLGLRGLGRKRKLKVGHIPMWPYMFQAGVEGVDRRLLDIMEQSYVFSSEIFLFTRHLSQVLENGTEIGVFPDVREVNE